MLIAINDKWFLKIWIKKKDYSFKEKEIDFRRRKL